MGRLWILLFCLAELSCRTSKGRLGDALQGYRGEQSQSSSELVSGATQDRWESPLQIMISRDKPHTNDEIRALCQSPTRLQLVPLEEGQTLSPETDFKVYKEGRSCYDRDIFGSCTGWNYHGTFGCFYYLNKAATP